jgi:hypothetical protein
MAKNVPKISTMVGENFEICLSQMVKNTTIMINTVHTEFHIEKIRE